jgi:hypothetical protein
VESSLIAADKTRSFPRASAGRMISLRMLFGAWLAR